MIWRINSAATEAYSCPLGRIKEKNKVKNRKMRSMNFEEEWRSQIERK